MMQSAGGMFSYFLVSKKGFKEDLIKNKPKDLTLLSLADLGQIWNEETDKILNSQELLISFM